jgi:hypothetical protein
MLCEIIFRHVIPRQSLGSSGDHIFYLLLFHNFTSTFWKVHNWNEVYLEKFRLRGATYVVRAYIS